MKSFVHDNDCPQSIFHTNDGKDSTYAVDINDTIRLSLTNANKTHFMVKISYTNSAWPSVRRHNE